MSSSRLSQSGSFHNLIDKNDVSVLVIANIFKYLTDTELSNLAVSHAMADQTLSDVRWIKKLHHLLFNGFYLNFLMDELGAGRSLVEVPHVHSGSTEEVKQETRESKIKKQTDAFINEMKQAGVNHFQSIYARYKKLKYLKKNQGNTLSQDKFILLSRQDGLVKNWLQENRNKVIRHEPLCLENRSALFYLALSGDVNGLTHYKYLFFDVKMFHFDYGSIPPAVALSGNARAIKYCVEELNIDMGHGLFGEKDHFPHFLVRSGSPSALEYGVKHLSLNTKATKTDKQSVHHMAAATGNADLMWSCKDNFKKSLVTDLMSTMLGVQHFAAESGSRAAILACNEMKLDMNAAAAGKKLQHFAAASGKREALEVCAELKLDMKALTDKGWGVQHFAATGGRESLLYCRDKGLDMHAQTGDTTKIGIQHILAWIGKPEDFALCKELLLDIDKLDGCEDGFEFHAGRHGNRCALLFFKNTGTDFRISKPATGLGRGAQHGAAESGDPLTILTTVELGLDLNEVAGVCKGAGYYAARSQNPAALLLMQLLNVSLNFQNRQAARLSNNPAVSQLAHLMFFYMDYHNHYPNEIISEWDKIIFENKIEHVAAFFISMSNKKSVGAFSSGFSLNKKERKILKELAYQMQTMKDNNLARVYIYLNYTHLNLVKSEQVSFKCEPTSFLAIMRYASDKVLDQIHALKLKNLAENAGHQEPNKRPGF